MMIVGVYGNIIIISIGIPIIVGLVLHIRETRIETLLMRTIDKMKSSIEVMNHITFMRQKVMKISSGHGEDLILIGIANLHVLECQIADCPCKNNIELYDPATRKFSQKKGNVKQNIFRCLP